MSEAADAPVEVARVAGQDFGWTGPVFAVPEKQHVGHRADPDSYTRSRNKPYKAKITRQKNGKKA